jgi:hypothetical protein
VSDRLRLISHPFHNGLEGVGMGAAPLRLLADAFPLVLAGASLTGKGCVDLDVLDPSEGGAKRFAADGCLTVAELEGAIELAFDRFHVAAAAITAYDPALDTDGRMAGAAAAVIRTIGHRALSQ